MNSKVIPLLFLFISSFTLQSQIQYSVDAFPTNIGGKIEFKRVFEQELQYPKIALQNKQSGRVELAFAIHADSSISNVIITKNVSPEIDAEALRLFTLYQWVPALKEGKYISTKWSCGFDFEEAKYVKIVKKRGYDKPKYSNQYPVDTLPLVYKRPDQIAMYYKGNYGFEDFIKENIDYPKQAQLANIQGVVKVRFVVEPNGLVTNIGIDKSVGGGCDQEAMRLIELTKWQPAVHAGKWVRCQMVVPIYFKLNEDFKDNAASEQR
ncbi:MAG: TonB family protein [Bacteroidia bacterium]|nr:TonB family protein [Bacteroidia bacterium]